jgi:hypothetical protein
MLTMASVSHSSKRKRDAVSCSPDTTTTTTTATTAVPAGASLLPSAMLAKQTPLVNMRVEILDTDHLWSPGYLVKVSGSQVTVAFDGWGRQWDETLAWGNERLAPLFTYTKRAKCLVDMLAIPKGRKPSKQQLEHLPPGAHLGYCSLWPCVVQCRMPHPASPEQGELGLRLEEKVFCQPYHPELLPPAIRESLGEDRGCWYRVAKVRLWRDQPLMLGILPDGFAKAFDKAQRDDVGVLCASAFEKGTSLLNPHLRVMDMKGAAGRDGRLVPSETTVPPLAKKPRVEPPTIVQIRPMPEGARPPRYHAPPTLPAGIPLQEALYPGITKCRSDWMASLAVNGNAMLLGRFPTQTQAHQAMLRATQTSSRELAAVETDIEQANRMDLLAIPMENIIMAYEEQYNPSVHSFSLHKWTLEKVNHYCYLREKEKFEGNVAIAKKSDPVLPRKNKRKQGRPTKRGF